MKSTEILNSLQVSLTINRLCFQLIENHNDFSSSVLIGLQPNGIFLANRLKNSLQDSINNKVSVGSLDITFFRDDFRRRQAPIYPNQTNINFLVESKNVVFIDDVLYTGRSIRAGMDAINSFGRPKQIELCVLIDRRFSRELPIEPNYYGKKVDAIDTEKVVVEWDSEKDNGCVTIIKG